MSVAQPTDRTMAEAQDGRWEPVKEDSGLAYMTRLAETRSTVAPTTASPGRPKTNIAAPIAARSGLRLVTPLRGQGDTVV